VYYSGGERAERGEAIVVQKSTMRSVVKKSVCSDRNIALKLKAEPVIEGKIRGKERRDRKMRKTK
jgi:hypothetical protein